MRSSLLLLVATGCAFLDEQLTDEICRFQIEINEVNGGVDLVQLNPDQVCKIQGAMPNGLEYEILLDTDGNPLEFLPCEHGSRRVSYTVRDLEAEDLAVVPLDATSPGRVSFEEPSEFVDGNWFRAAYVEFDGEAKVGLQGWSAFFQLGSANTALSCDDESDG